MISLKFVIYNSKELDMEKPSVNVIISLLNVSDGQDQHTIQVTEDYEDLIEKVARIIMSLHTEILYGDGFIVKFAGNWSTHCVGGCV